MEEQSITMTLADILADMDNSEVTYQILLEYSKPFDCISHNLILVKLKFYGLAEIVIR